MRLYKCICLFSLYKRICTWTYVRTHVNSARNPRSLLRCTASSRRALDRAGRRAILYSAPRQPCFSSALSKAPFLRSLSLRLNLASCGASMIYMSDRGQRSICSHSHKSRRGTFTELRNNIIRINRDVEHLRNDVRTTIYIYI